MKTCPNCQATRIPDSAQFCPKCGELLADPNTPWQEKCKELNKEKQKLQNDKREWASFNKERNKMLSVLRQNSDFESEMKVSSEAIQYNRTKLPRKEVWAVLVGLAMMIVSVLIFVLVTLKRNQFGLPEWLHTPSFIVSICLLLWGIGILRDVSSIIDIEERPFYNHYISDFYMPFIERHILEYESIIGYLGSDPCKRVAEVEVTEPESITKGVEQNIEKTNRRIEEIDKQIQLMKDIM